MGAVNPDVRPFLKRGGKLLIYHGWDDAAIAAGNTLRYHAALRRSVGSAAKTGVRLFMMPGVAHCAGGHGPDNFDYFGELDRWTESGRAPERIVATQGNGLFRQLMGQPLTVTRSRPLCAWPKTARYKGRGSIDEASSFDCR